ncbi:hypothetical protein LCGC14_1178900 [marine sediment metagenome]|uniref:Uncharacterized protein n=1 Tax=marine sediment metagenome TaxID=412755 RepID=A0A0F9MAJ5_9ZZZZ
MSDHLDAADKLDAYQKKYQQTPKGREAEKKYKGTPKGKGAVQRWRDSEKGYIARKRYRMSEKGKATKQRYEDQVHEFELIQLRIDSGACVSCGVNRATTAIGRFPVCGLCKAQISKNGSVG